MTIWNWLAIILIAVVCAGFGIATSADIFKRLDWLERYLENKIDRNYTLINRIDTGVMFIKYNTPSEVVNTPEKPEKPYVGEVKLTDIHGDEWYGQLRRTNKVESGYLFELYDDFRKSNREARE
jgi:hypothetical protein